MEKPDLFEQLIELEKDYHKKFHPTFNPQSNEAIHKFYRKNDLWVQTMQSIDDDWFKKAKRINKIRNSAAHSFDPENIYRKFGYNGVNRFEQAKTECIDLIKSMLKIEKV